MSGPGPIPFLTPDMPGILDILPKRGLVGKLLAPARAIENPMNALGKAGSQVSLGIGAMGIGNAMGGGMMGPDPGKRPAPPPPMESTGGTLPGAMTMSQARAMPPELDTSNVLGRLASRMTPKNAVQPMSWEDMTPPEQPGPPPARVGVNPDAHLSQPSMRARRIADMMRR